MENKLGLDLQQYENKIDLGLQHNGKGNRSRPTTQQKVKKPRPRAKLKIRQAWNYRPMEK